MDAELTIRARKGEDEEGQAAARPTSFTRIKITSGLAAIGGFCGAGAGIVLTFLGNRISGYPIPPSVGIYGWNAGIMAVISATLGPPVAWSLLRAVPLWRTLLEPAVAGVVAGVGSMLFAPTLFGAVVPLAIFAAALRLRWEYRNVERQSLGLEVGEAALAAPSPQALEEDLGGVP